MIAADANEDDTLKKPTVRLTDDTSEKEMEAFKKPPGNLTADAFENEPFKNPLPPGNLTGKIEGLERALSLDRTVSPPRIKLWLIKMEGLERVMDEIKMVSLPKIKLWLLTVLIQIILIMKQILPTL